MPSLRDKLEAQRRTMSDEVRHAYEVSVAEMRNAGLGAHSLALGERFPDMVLPNAEGDLVAIADLLRRGPVVVTFFRGIWCPYCRIMLDALVEALPEIEATGASLVGVTPETGGLALRTKQNHHASFEVLSDVDCGLGLSCGVVFRTPDIYRRLLLKYGNDLGDRHGNQAWFLPVPTVFVLDRDGIVRWRFLSVDFTEQAEPADILAAIRSLPDRGR
ncbi:MAG: AhpC/TSA family protein [Rhodospirillales bacterium]|nr:AhpC/TSA family protein [Rhodospirillales bacterium]